MGNRIAKIEKPRQWVGGVAFSISEVKPQNEWNYTYYSRDASGNIMATYTPTFLSQYEIEYPLYGSSRLGIKKFNSSAIFERNSRILGDKFYELSNHLGNVNVVVSDRRKGVDFLGIINLADYYLADVVSATDYYPFGCYI